ncbi:LWR-salt protein [Halogeometricum borinquense]|uniref:LWR-salt protein n=1 Tax=Halogeometricum borinquense TaxID=60847 RepID=A0A6C0UJ09_9EURY|nr:LWR-salt protein [Halogeometricum borinquense]QIB75425.1 LWR-salt protein [Halogeometricum borinquense]QIQ75693.1 LWR-salt protein [Halogeometricum borinquense]
MNAAYVFRVRFRLDPASGVRTNPRSFETVVEVPADEPGEGDWLFFRNTLWRGEVNDDRYARELAEEWLSLPVESVSFSELRADEAYMEALRTAIAADLTLFNADSTREVLHKYLGSSIRIEDDS